MEAGRRGRKECMKDMNVIKVCFRSEFIINSTLIERVSKELSRIGYSVHVQLICNNRYLCWLRGLSKMEWDWILDIFISGDAKAEVFRMKIQPLLEREILKEALDNIDVYIVSQLIYGKPVDDSELITSCYLWNYNTPRKKRNDAMLEHFKMEQKQLYYAYVAFQCVELKIFERSPTFDFFFISHVPDPKGINEIYSKTALEEMRVHSKTFLDLNSRLLSFGRICVIEGEEEHHGI
jgi:hypothetical protein